jgi:hypothetical protein
MLSFLNIYGFVRLFRRNTVRPNGFFAILSLISIICYPDSRVALHSGRDTGLLLWDRPHLFAACLCLLFSEGN